MDVLSIIKNIPLILWMLRKRISIKASEGWVNKYLDIKLKELSVKPTEQQIFLGFIARYGVGKTTVAKKISERLPFFVISSDEGRRLLQQNGVSSDIVGKEKFIFFMGLKVIQELIHRKINILLDADLMQPHFRKKLQQILGERGYKLLLAHVVAEDKIVWDRITQRRLTEESEYIRENMERHFAKRKEIHATEPMPDTFFTFVNNGDISDLDKQIDEFVTKAREEFKL